MTAELRYDSLVRRVFLVSISASTIAVLLLVFSPRISAQTAGAAPGVPASVTSTGFGGHTNHPGIPASVTSTGTLMPPHPRPPVANQPGCCINPLFPVNPNPSAGGQGGRHPRHPGRRGGYAGGILYYPVPYTSDTTMDWQSQSGENPSQDQNDDVYRGGPTIFDRRGPGMQLADENRYVPPPAHEPQPAASGDSDAAAEPVANTTPTILVFKDGHRLEISNYAIVGDTLFDLTPGHRRKIPLAELDLAATSKQNDDRGIDFRLPAGTQGS